MEEKNAREDRRVRRTRARLTAAFTQLLREKPLQEITVKELTERADVNRGTFYIHYRDVNDMLEQIESGLFRELADVMDAYDSTRLRLGLLPILRDAFRFVHKNAELCEVLLENRADDHFFQHLSQLIYERSVRQWRDLYPLSKIPGGQYTLDFLVAGVVGMARTWASGGFAESAETMAVIAEGLILRGIGSGPTASGGSGQEVQDNERPGWGRE